MVVFDRNLSVIPVAEPTTTVVTRLRRWDVKLPSRLSALTSNVKFQRMHILKGKMMSKLVANSLLSICLLSVMFSAIGNSDIQAGAAKFAASCPSVLSKLDVYRDMAEENRTQICSCTSKKIDDMISENSNVAPTQFSELVKTALFACAEESMRNHYESMCRNDKDLMTIFKEKLSFTEKQNNDYCSCVAKETTAVSTGKSQALQKNTMQQSGKDLMARCMSQVRERKVSN